MIRLPRRDVTALTDAIPLCSYSHVKSQGRLPCDCTEWWRRWQAAISPERRSHQRTNNNQVVRSASAEEAKDEKRVEMQRQGSFLCTRQ